MVDATPEASKLGDGTRIRRKCVRLTLTFGDKHTISIARVNRMATKRKKSAPREKRTAAPVRVVRPHACFVRLFEEERTLLFRVGAKGKPLASIIREFAISFAIGLDAKNRSK